MPKMTRVFVVGLIMAYCAFASASIADQSAPAEYPSKPVSIITPASAGSGPDMLARATAEHLTRVWGQQVVIINRPGAGGIVSLQTAASAPTDGYTLYVGFASLFVAFPEAQPHMALDLQKLTPIGLLGEQPMMIAVSPKLGLNTLGDLLDHARQRPGEILYGGFRATMPHLTGAMLASRAKVNLGFVPSAGPRAVQDVLGGSLHVAIEGLGPINGPAQSGLLRPIAVAARTRLSEHPDVPTVGEAVPALENFEARGWIALFAPKGTPDAIVQKLNGDLQSVLADPDMTRRLAVQGTYPRPMSPAETAEFIRREQDLWRPIVKQLDLTSK